MSSSRVTHGNTAADGWTLSGRRRSTSATVPACLLLLAAALAGCYAPVHHSRRDVAPTWRSDAVVRGDRGLGSRLRFDAYTLTDFRGSAATRQWPLLDSRTRSHRYDFAVRDHGERIVDAECLLMTIVADEARVRTTLECTLLQHARRGGDWRLQLGGRRDLEGVLHGEDREYRVLHAAANDLLVAGQPGRAAGYLVYDGSEPVAAVERYGRGAVWMQPELGDGERGVLAAAIFALLARDDLAGIQR